MQAAEKCRFLSLVTLTFVLWPWPSNSSERGTKHVFRENLVQIRSAVSEIFHTQKPQNDVAKNRTFHIHRGWVNEDANRYGSRPRPRPHCVRQEPSSPAKGAQQPPPLFGPCLLWPRSPIPATSELLYYLLYYGDISHEQFPSNLKTFLFARAYSSEAPLRTSV